MESVASVREDMVVPTMGEFDMTSFEAPEELETRNISARNNRKQQRRGTVAPGGNNRHGGDGDVVDSDDEGPLNESIFLSSMSRAHGFADPLPVYHDPLLDDGETYVNNHAEQHQNLIQMVGLSQQFPLSMRQAKDAQKAAAAGGAGGGGQQPMKMTLNGSMLHPSQTKKGATIKAGASSVGAHLRHQHRLREQHLRQQQRAAAGGGGSSSSSDDDQPGRGGASDAFPQPLYAGGEDAQLEADNLMSGAAGETGSITSPQQQHQQTLITDPDSPVAPGPTASPAANNNFRAATPATKNFRPVRKFFKARLRQAKRFMNLLHFNDKMKERQFVVFNNDNDIEGIVAMVLSVLGAVFYFTTSYWTPQVWAFIFIIPLMSIITLVRVAFTIYSRYHRVQLNRLIDEVEQQRLKEEKEVEQLTKAEMFYRTRALMDQKGQKDSGGESDIDDRASKSKRREKKRAKAVVNTMENNEKVIDTAKMDFEVLQFHTAIWHERLVLIFIFLNNAIILLSYPNKQFCTRANDPIVNRDCRVSFWLWPGAYAAMLLYIFVSVPRIMPTTGALVVVHSIFFFVGRWFDTTDDEGVVYASQTVLGFCICVVTLTFLYKSEEMRREMFTTAERVNRFRKQSEALLSRQGDHVESMVPPVIARILIDTKGNVSFSYEGTVACIRMGHVTRWCSERSGAEIATQINDLFAILDRAAETTKVLHVQTFGDMYVVISGLGRFTTPIENAERACLFAAAVSDGRETQLRVAICSGEVHGVVRSRQLSYDLCGGTYDACISLVYQGEVPASVMNTATMRLTGCRTLGEIADRFAKEARDRRRRKRKVKRLQQQQGLSLKAAEERVSRMDDDEVASVKRAGGSSKKSTSSRDKHNSKGANNNTITGPSANVVMILNGVTVSPSHFSIPTDDTPFNEDEEEPQQQQPATTSTKKSDSPTHKKGAPTATGSLPVSRSGSKNAAAAAAKSSKSTGDRTSKNFLAKYANPDLNIHDLGIKVETDEIGDVDEMPPFMSRKLRGERFFAYTGLQTRLEKTRDRHISRGPLVPSLDFPDEEIEECFVRDVSIRVISSAAVVAGSLFFTGLSLGAFVLCYWDLRDRPDRDTNLAGIVSRVSFGMSSLASFFMLFCVRKLKVDNALWLYFPIMILFILGIVMAPPGILNNNLQVWSLVLYLISYMLLPPGVMSTLKWFILNGIVVAAPLSVATIVLDTFAVISTIAYHFAALIFLSYMHMQQEFQARSRFLDTILSYFLAKSLQAETVAMRELLQVPLQALSVLDRCSSVELPLLKKDEVDPLGMYGTNGRLRLLDLDLAEMTPIHQGVDETALLCIYFADGRDVAAFFGHNVKKEKGPLASVFLLRLCWAVCDEVVEAHGEGKVYKAGVFGGNVVLATVRDSLKAVGCLARCAQHILAKLASHGREVVTTCTLTAGPIASAVVGNKFLSFQLFGDTVQTASRVLAAAPPGSMTCSDRFAFLYECWCDEELDVWYSESEGEEEEIHNEEVCEITSPLINQQKNSTDAAAGAIANNGNVYGEEMMLAQPPSRNNSSYDNSVLPNQLAGSNTLHAASVNSFSATSITTQPLATHPGVVTSPNSAPIQDLSVTSGSGFVSGSGVPPNLPDEGKKHHRRSGAAGSIVDPLQASAAIYGDGDNNYDDDMEDEEDGDMDDAFYPPLILHEPMPWKIRGRGVVRIRYVSVTVPEEPLD